MITTKLPIGNTFVTSCLLYHICGINGGIPICQFIFYDPHHSGIVFAVIAGCTGSLIPKSRMNITIPKDQEAVFIDAMIPILHTRAAGINIIRSYMAVCLGEKVIFPTHIGMDPVIKQIYRYTCGVGRCNDVLLQMEVHPPSWQRRMARARSPCRPSRSRAPWTVELPAVAATR